MIKEKLAAIDDLSSALFRIMTITNDDEPYRRQYDNNICAFHIGNGYILSVAHALKPELNFFRSIGEAHFQESVMPNLNDAERLQFQRWYTLDEATQKRHLTVGNENEMTELINILKRINFDTRVITLYEKKICKPYLLIQQKATAFYNNLDVHKLFHPDLILLDPVSQRQTYLIETVLVEAFYSDDVALYKIVNTHQHIIDLLPSFAIDVEVYDTANKDFFCLQSAPSDANPGRMINEANIEGLIDQFSIQPDRFGGSYIFQGLRYLIKGYFRFGSSGAPYLKYDNTTNTFKVNAIQSEACPIQLTINNDRNGNSQWVNAIATPLANVVERINKHRLGTN